MMKEFALCIVLIHQHLNMKAIEIEMGMMNITEDLQTINIRYLVKRRIQKILLSKE